MAVASAQWGAARGALNGNRAVTTANREDEERTQLFRAKNRLFRINPLQKLELWH
jgi:hypothetical protein